MNIRDAVRAAVDRILAGQPSAILRRPGDADLDAWAIFGGAEEIGVEDLFSDSWEVVPLPEGYDPKFQLDRAREWHAYWLTLPESSR